MSISQVSQQLFRCREYQFLNFALLIFYGFFVLVFLNREYFHAMQKPSLSLFVDTAPNLLMSIFFTLIVVFYVVPLFSKTTMVIHNSKYLWIANGINLLVFGLFEWLHVLFDAGSWDNRDMLASCLGIGLATILYYTIRKYFSISIAEKQ